MSVEFWGGFCWGIAAFAATLAALTAAYVIGRSHGE